MPGLKYYWFDTPDGHDILKKTNFAAKLGFLAGWGPAIFDHCLNPERTMKVHAFRAAACFIPAVGTGVMFAVTSQLLCRHFPEMKPEVSYALGGLSAGTVLGAAFRSMTVGSVAGIYFAVIAAASRDIHNYWREYPTVFGNLPRVAVINDDPLMAGDYRNAPKLSLPPPIARPAKVPSLLDSYY